MTLPEQDSTTGYLPPGDHEATLDEVLARYSESEPTTMRRRELGRALRRAVEQLQSYGVDKICIDGSYTKIDKKRPGDVDIWYKAPSDAEPSQWGKYSPPKHDFLMSRERVDLCWHPMRGSMTDATLLPEYWRTKNEVEKGLIWIREG